MSDVPTPDEIISGRKNAGLTKRVFLVDQEGKPYPLNADQEKAFGIVLGGMAYLVVGVRPTIGDRGNPGADFFTVTGGNPEHLRDAKCSLGDVIDRAYARGGIL